MPITMPIRTPSARTLAELEAGKKRVMQHAHPKMIEALKRAGLDTSKIKDPTTLQFHMELAKGVGAIPETMTMRHCASCGGEHKEGQRCPKVAEYVERHLVRNP